MSVNLQTEHQKLYLDFNQNVHKTVLAKQYDKASRFVPIQCTDDGVPFLLNSTFTVQAKTLTADNRALLENAVTVQSDGSLLLELTENMLYSPGKAHVEIIIFDTKNNRRLSPMCFDLIVEPSVYDEDRIIASDEFSALTDLYYKASSLSNEKYTTTATPPENQKDGDYWTRLL